MARTLLDGLLLFVLPFVVYVAVLLLQRRFPFLRPHWTGGRLAMLTVAGLGLVLLGMVVVGLVVPRHQGAYRPAHLEGGRLVPGEID